MFSINYFAVQKRFALVLLFSAFVYAGSKVPSEAMTQAGDSAKPVTLPPDTLIFAQLSAELDIAHCRPGDRIEAEITQGVKVNHAVVLRNGGRVIGQIIKAAAPDASGLYGVLIVFDSIAAKDGGLVTSNMDVQAISPPETGYDPVPDPDPTLGLVGQLTSRSKGAINLPGVTLAAGNDNGKRVTILTSKKGDIRLPKRSQIIFRTTNP